MTFSLIQEIWLYFWEKDVEGAHNQEDGGFCMSSVVKEKLPGNEEGLEAIAA